MINNKNNNNIFFFSNYYTELFMYVGWILPAIIQFKVKFLDRVEEK